MPRRPPDSPFLRLPTVAVHAGLEHDPLAGAIMPPIYQTSTYIQDRLGQPHNGFEYARTRNPTREALEQALAALEGGERGFAFSSGLAALDVVLKLFSPGDQVIVGANLYGGSHRLMERVYRGFGIDFLFVDLRDPNALEAAVTPATRMVYAETPTNPMMFLTDLAAIGSICRTRELLFVVDNTFATPVLQRPLEQGADIVLHSTTKYLNGHSDMVGGALIVRREDLATRIAFLQNAAGAVPGPFDCWLALRGIRTLTLRMEQHSKGAAAVAAWLESRADIPKVYYPGLTSHPQFALARRQMSKPGGMISVDLGDVERARQTVDRVRIFALAESLGGVESLIGHPASMTHASVPEAMRRDMGLTDSLIRLSIGIEDPQDLIEDLAQALGR